MNDCREQNLYIVKLLSVAAVIRAISSGIKRIRSAWTAISKAASQSRLKFDCKYHRYYIVSFMKIKAKERISIKPINIHNYSDMIDISLCHR